MPSIATSASREDRFTSRSTLVRRLVPGLKNATRCTERAPRRGFVHGRQEAVRRAHVGVRLAEAVQRQPPRAPRRPPVRPDRPFARAAEFQVVGVEVRRPFPAPSDSRSAS